MTARTKPKESAVERKHEQVIRVCYKIRRIADGTWAFGVTLTNRRTTWPYIGGHEWRMVAAFGTNAELGEFVKKHPAPKPFVAGMRTCDLRSDQMRSYYGGELGDKIFYGVPLPWAQTEINKYKLTKREDWLAECRRAEAEMRLSDLENQQVCKCGHDGFRHADPFAGKRRCYTAECGCDNFKPKRRYLVKRKP